MTTHRPPPKSAPRRQPHAGSKPEGCRESLPNSGSNRRAAALHRRDTAPDDIASAAMPKRRAAEQEDREDLRPAATEQADMEPTTACCCRRNIQGRHRHGLRAGRGQRCGAWGRTSRRSVAGPSLMCRSSSISARLAQEAAVDRRVVAGRTRRPPARPAPFAGTAAAWRCHAHAPAPVTARQILAGRRLQAGPRQSRPGAISPAWPGQVGADMARAIQIARAVLRQHRRAVSVLAA